jgi:hypothetical protein
VGESDQALSAAKEAFAVQFLLNALAFAAATKVPSKTLLSRIRTLGWIQLQDVFEAMRKEAAR